MDTTNSSALMYKEAIAKLEAKGRDKFFPWFDGGKNADDSFNRAQQTFDTMMLPWAEKYIEGSFKIKRSLDIGHGGGGQLLRASSIFKTAFGIDVHNSNTLLNVELMKRSCFNVFMYSTDSHFFPLGSNCIDFAHSWAVFMHLGSMDTVRVYLQEIYRVLKYGGIAVIYFSRLFRSKVDQTQEEYRKDITEETKIQKGYNEKQDVPVNQINLRIALWRMEAEAEHAGLTIVNRTASHQVKNRQIIVGGQHGLILRKDITTQFKGDT